MPELHTVNSKESLEAFIEDCRRRFSEPPHYTQYEIHDKEKVRTLTQNRAIHLFCARIAEALNDAGMERKVTSDALSGVVEEPWNLYLVKKDMWAPVMLAQTGKDSTTDLNTQEVGLIADILQRHFASKKNVIVEFPTRRISHES